MFWQNFIKCLASEVQNFDLNATIMHEDDMCIEASAILDDMESHRVVFWLNNDGSIQCNYHENNIWFIKSLTARTFRRVLNNLKIQIKIESESESGEAESYTLDFDLRFPTLNSWKSKYNPNLFYKIINKLNTGTD